MIIRLLACFFLLWRGKRGENGGRERERERRRGKEASGRVAKEEEEEEEKNRFERHRSPAPQVPDSRIPLSPSVLQSLAVICVSSARARRREGMGMIEGD